MRLSTTWDKFEIDGEKVSKKVFMLRGDEAYARTTDCLVTCSNVRNTFYEGFKVNVRVDVLRGLGSSVCYLYDGEQKLGQFNTTTNVTSHTFEDLQLSYDAEHDIKAVYMGSEQCLKSQSKTQQLYEDIPDQFKVNIAIDNTTIYPSLTSITKTATLSGILGDSSYNNIDVLWYVDGEYVETTNTGSSTSASCNIGTLSDGNHTIMAEVETENNLYGNRTSETISIGYNVSILDYPTTFLCDGTDKVTVSVLDYNNNPVSGATVTFATYTATTGVDGIATITVSNITEGTYHASCGGDVSSDIVVDVLDINGLTLTAQDGVVLGGRNMRGTELLTATLTGDVVSNIPITFSGDISVNGVQYTDSDGVASVVYNGTGKGDVMITANFGEYTSSVALEDVIVYANKGTIKGMYGIFNVSISRYSQYCSFRFRRNGYVELFKTSPVAPDDGWYQAEMNIASLNISNLTSSFKFCDVITVEPSQITAGILKIVSDNTSIRVYMNGEVIGQATQTGSKTTTLKIQSVGGTATLNFDSLKVKKL